VVVCIIARCEAAAEIQRLDLTVLTLSRFRAHLQELVEMPPRPPGKWKAYLDTADFVRLLGVSYRVAAPPPVAAQKKLSARPSSASSDRSSDSEGNLPSTVLRNNLPLLHALRVVGRLS
jgi:hypothetical protein